MNGAEKKLKIIHRTRTLTLPKVVNGVNTDIVCCIQAINPKPIKSKGKATLCDFHEHSMKLFFVWKVLFCFDLFDAISGFLNSKILCSCKNFSYNQALIVLKGRILYYWIKIVDG